MTLSRRLPSPEDARRLADLVADAQAIPAAAFRPAAGSSDDVVRPGIRLDALRIPDHSVSLVQAADHHWTDFSR
jgi:hypothetical protein